MKLKELMAQKRWNITSFAKALHKSRCTVWNWCNGHYLPNVTDIKAMGGTFGSSGRRSSQLFRINGQAKRKFGQAIKHTLNGRTKMPAKRNTEFKIIHEFADGRIMTGEEFMQKPFTVSYEKNEEIYEQARIAYAPDEYAAERKRRQRESVVQRREALKLEAERIRAELEKLDQI